MKLTNTDNFQQSFVFFSLSSVNLSSSPLYAFLNTSFQCFPLSSPSWLCLASPLCTSLASLSFSLLFSFSSFPSPLSLERIWSHRHSARLSSLHPGDHSSLPAAPTSSLLCPPIHPSTHLSIHRLPLFLDFCYPTPGPARVSLPFPPLIFACVSGPLYFSTSSCVSYLINYQMCSNVRTRQGFSKINA